MACMVWRPLAASVAFGGMVAASGGALGGAGSAAAAVAHPAAARSPSAQSWQVLYHSTASSELSSVVAISQADAWAAGYFGKLYHPTGALVLRFNGTRWSGVRVPGARSLRAAGVAASSASDVWIFGGNNKILRWNGHRWLTEPHLPGAPVSESSPSYDPGLGAVVLSSSDVWLLGGWSSGPKGFFTTVWHWNGHRWQGRSVPHVVGTGLSAVSAHDAWLVGNASPGLRARITALRWNGRSWRRVPMPRAYDYYCQPAVAMASAKEVWLGANVASAAGQGLERPASIMRWTASHGWTESAQGPMTAGAPYGFATDGAGGVWDGPFADWTGQSWVNADPGSSLLPGFGYQFYDIARIPRTTDVWGVGAATTSPAATTWSAMISKY